MQKTKQNKETKNKKQSEWVSERWTSIVKNNVAETRDSSGLGWALRIWTRDLQIFSLTLSQLSYFGR